MKGNLTYREEYNCGCNVAHYQTIPIRYYTKGLFKVKNYMDYVYECVGCGKKSQVFTVELNRDGQVVKDPGVV